MSQTALLSDVVHALLRSLKQTICKPLHDTVKQLRTLTVLCKISIQNYISSPMHFHYNAVPTLAVTLSFGRKPAVY